MDENLNSIIEKFDLKKFNIKLFEKATEDVKFDKYIGQYNGIYCVISLNLLKSYTICFFRKKANGNYKFVNYGKLAFGFYVFDKLNCRARIRKENNIEYIEFVEYSKNGKVNTITFSSTNFNITEKDIFNIRYSDFYKLSMYVFECDRPNYLSFGDDGKVRTIFYLKETGGYHRENDKPAIIVFKKNKVLREGWYINDECYREKGPAEIEYRHNGNIRSKKFRNGCINDSKLGYIRFDNDNKINCITWSKCSDLHRDKFPAKYVFNRDYEELRIEICWCNEGYLHNENGPARILLKNNEIILEFYKYGNKIENELVTSVLEIKMGEIERKIIKSLEQFIRR